MAGKERHAAMFNTCPRCGTGKSTIGQRLIGRMRVIVVLEGDLLWREPCVERRYFSSVSYGALVCQEAELRRRLEARPAWRGSRDPSFRGNRRSGDGVDRARRLNHANRTARTMRVSMRSLPRLP